METQYKPLEKMHEPGNPKTKPTVTILLPAYNEAEIISRSLTILCDHMSALNEKYNWDLLIVNDGSKDANGRLA